MNINNSIQTPSARDLGALIGINNGFDLQKPPPDDRVAFLVEFPMSLSKRKWEMLFSIVTDSSARPISDFTIH
jgi:hypothetical protein